MAGHNEGNPFDKGQDFLSFSSLTPQGLQAGRSFKMRRSKANRQDNWQRFGQHMAQEEGGHGQTYFYRLPAANNGQSFYQQRG